MAEVHDVGWLKARIRVVSELEHMVKLDLAFVIESATAVHAEWIGCSDSVNVSETPLSPIPTIATLVR